MKPFHSVRQVFCLLNGSLNPSPRRPEEGWQVDLDLGHTDLDPDEGTSEAFPLEGRGGFLTCGS